MVLSPDLIIEYMFYYFKRQNAFVLLANLVGLAAYLIVIMRR